MIDHAQQAGIDLVTLRQRLVQVHAAHHGAQVRGGERHDGIVQPADLVSRLGRVQHLEEHHRVHADHGVVLGDDFLARNVEHLFHHVDLVADAIDEGDDQMQPRIGRERVLAEPSMVDIALLHHAHAHHQEQHDQQDQQDQD